MPWKVFLLFPFCFPLTNAFHYLGSLWNVFLCVWILWVMYACVIVWCVNVVFMCRVRRLCNLILCVIACLDVSQAKKLRLSSVSAAHFIFIICHCQNHCLLFKNSPYEFLFCFYLWYIFFVSIIPSPFYLKERRSVEEHSALIFAFATACGLCWREKGQCGT